MRVTIEIRINPTDTGDGGELIEIATIDRDDTTVSPATLGLSIEEAKQILTGANDVVAVEHAARAIEVASSCSCGRRFAHKDSRPLQVRTLYGVCELDSPRWWTCPCAGERATFSPLPAMLTARVTPELGLVEAKLAAHMSYQAASGLLGELFPTGRRIHREEISRTVHTIADRLDAEHADDFNGCFIDRPPDDDVIPGMPVAVSLDGGYVHSSLQTSRRDGWFQAVVGSVTDHDGQVRRFGFVPTIDQAPRARIRHVLDEAGVRQDQMVTFLTDGADDLAGFTDLMNHQAEYVLDWFHIAMRFTVAINTVKGLRWTVDDEYPDDDQDDLDRAVAQLPEELASAKWFLWQSTR